MLKNNLKVWVSFVLVVFAVGLLLVFLVSPRNAVAFSTQDTIYNVKDYGAVGNGTTDDTTAISNATSAAAGAILYFPKGTYKCNGLTLQANTQVMGEGSGSILKSKTGNVNVITLNNGCKVTAMTIDGYVAGHTTGSIDTSGGIFANNVTDYEIKDCKIFNCYGTGINLRYSDRGRITDNFITDCWSGVEWWGGDASVGGNPDIFDVTIIGNIVKNGSAGIWGSKGERITVTGNTIENCSDVGIDFEGSIFCTANGNSVRNCSNGGLTAFYGSQNITFSGNVVKQDSGFGNGIWVTSTLANTKLTIIGNNVSAASSHAFYGDQGAMNNSLVEGNLFEVTSGSTSAVRILEGTKNNIINNNVYVVSSSTGISFEGSCDSIISGNYIEASSDTSNVGTGGGVFLYWRSSSAPCQRNTVINNIIKGFVTSINDNCWGDLTSHNLMQNNRVSSIYRRSGTYWYGLVSGNVSITNPNTTVAAITY